MVRTQHSHCQVLGSIPGQDTNIPQAVWHGQKKKVYKCITQEQRNGKDP